MPRSSDYSWNSTLKLHLLMKKYFQTGNTTAWCWSFTPVLVKSYRRLVGHYWLLVCQKAGKNMFLVLWWGICCIWLGIYRTRWGTCTKKSFKGPKMFPSSINKATKRYSICKQNVEMDARSTKDPRASAVALCCWFVFLLVMLKSK